MIVQRCIGRLIKDGLLSADEISVNYPGKYSWKKVSKLIADTPCFKNYIQRDLFDYDIYHRCGLEKRR